MKVKIIATIEADIYMPSVPTYNSDTLSDYYAEVDSELNNAALDYLTDYLKNYDSITIDSVKPDDWDVYEFGKMLEKWYEEMDK